MGNLKVFGLGPGRSGTESLRIALIKLGFGPTYHMREILFEDEGISTVNDSDIWHDLALHYMTKKKSGSREDHDIEGDTEALQSLEKMLEPWNSGCDWPLIAFPEQLLKLYPDAKFILTIRPAQKWYTSMTKTICNVANEEWYGKIIRKIPLFPFSRFGPQFRMFNAVNRYAFDDHDFIFMCHPDNSKLVMDWYDDWNAKMEKIIPKEQLLIFNTGQDSYNELASFLNVPVPDEPYPRSNSTNEMKNIIFGLKAAASITIMVCILFVCMLLLVLRRLVSPRGIDRVKKE